MSAPCSNGRHRYGIVNDQWNAMGVCDVGQLCKIRDIAKRVANRLAKDRLGALIDQGRETLGLACIGEAHFDSHLRQRVREQVVGATV